MEKGVAKKLNAKLTCLLVEGVKLVQICALNMRIDRAPENKQSTHYVRKFFK